MTERVPTLSSIKKVKWTGLSHIFRKEVYNYFVHCPCIISSLATVDRFFSFCVFLAPTTAENTYSKISQPFLTHIFCNQHNSILQRKTVKAISTTPPPVHRKHKTNSEKQHRSQKIKIFNWKPTVSSCFF